MIDLKDYKAYMRDNDSFLDMLRRNDSLVYDRLRDLIKVLGYVEFLVDQGKKVEEELEFIFEVGFPFFHEQLEEIKIYYNKYCNKDYTKFKKYELLINYSLYIYELIDALKERKKYTNEAKKAFGEIQEEIEDIILNNKEEDPELLDRYNNIIESYVEVGTLSTLEIFGLIVEELQI